MLNAWAEFVRDSDPDILTGYNINNFDIPFLIDRAKHLKLEKFSYLGRILNIKLVFFKHFVHIAELDYKDCRFY